MEVVKTLTTPKPPPTGEETITDMIDAYEANSLRSLRQELDHLRNEIQSKDEIIRLLQKENENNNKNIDNINH